MCVIHCDDDDWGSEGHISRLTTLVMVILGQDYEIVLLHIDTNHFLNKFDPAIKIFPVLS